MANSNLCLAGVLLLAVFSLASCDTAPSHKNSPWKPPKTRTLVLTEGPLAVLEPKTNDEANVTTPVVYRQYVNCGEQGTNAGLQIGMCSWSGIFQQKLPGDTARILWQGDCSFEKPCGRYGTGSIVFSGIAGGLEKWDRTWDFPVTGGSGAFFGVTGVRTYTTENIQFKLIAPSS